MSDKGSESGSGGSSKGKKKDKKGAEEDKKCVNHEYNLPKGPRPGYPEWNPAPWKSRFFIETRNNKKKDGCCDDQNPPQ